MVFKSWIKYRLLEIIWLRLNATAKYAFYAREGLLIKTQWYLSIINGSFNNLIYTIIYLENLMVFKGFWLVFRCLKKFFPEAMDFT